MPCWTNRFHLACYDELVPIETYVFVCLVCGCFLMVGGSCVEEEASKVKASKFAGPVEGKKCAFEFLTSSHFFPFSHGKADRD